MTIHTCRDLLSSVASFPSSSMYLSSIFLLHVGNYTQIGNTALNITGSYLLATGSGASINLGVGYYNTVTIPTATYTVSALDVNNILALKSNSYPRHNSGLFRISSVDTINNRYNIDYRSTDNPPVEISTLQWAVFSGEHKLSGSMSTIGGLPYGTGYTSKWDYGDKRIILQSPHSSSWQIRYCYESSSDRTNNNVQISVAPGFNGDSKGDFITGSYDVSAPVAQHLHGQLWFNTSNDYYKGTSVGINKYYASDVSNAQVRFYGWVDDVSGSACFLTRNVANYSTNWYTFGLSEDDEPSTTQAIYKLFVFGSANAHTTDVNWTNGPSNLSLGYTGIAFGTHNMPVNCVWALYDYVGNVIGGATAGAGIKAESVATDNQILDATELQKVDLWAGTSNSGYNSNDTHIPLYNVFRFDPRRLGTMPLARVGRSNFGNWVTTTDTNKSWFHITNGVYLPWQGPAVYS